jgi:hypothetical protein
MRQCVLVQEINVWMIVIVVIMMIDQTTWESDARTGILEYIMLKWPSLENITGLFLVDVATNVLLQDISVLKILIAVLNIV